MNAYPLIYADQDMDGIGEGDNCPNVSNPNQADTDGMALGMNAMLTLMVMA